MTDEKKQGPSDEFDWDQALSEWESKSFSPQVAKEPEVPPKTAVPAGPVSRPLYRPPSPPKSAAGPGPGAPPPVPRPAAGRPPPLPPSAAKPPPLPPPPPPSPLDFDDEDPDNATVIANIPRELLGPAEPAEGPKSSSRGGLGQLFARDEKKEMSVEVSFDESQPRVPVSARSDAGEVEGGASEVFTSAQAVAARRPPTPVPSPLRRPSKDTSVEDVPDGAMFDPFVDPGSEPRSAQTTRPADDEVDGLLEAASAPAAPGPEDDAEPPAASEVPTARGALRAETPSEEPPPTAGDEPSEAPAEAAHPSRAPHGALRTEGEDEDEGAEAGPQLLSPEDRNYDPNEETMIGSPSVVARARAAAAALRRASSPPSGPPPLESVSRSWPDERPAHAWLLDDARRDLEERATWLEAEARAHEEPVVRARALLACSEIAAILGETDRAMALAVEARDLAPSVALAHRQARGLMPQPAEADAVVAALDVEIPRTEGAEGRVHSTLLAAEVLRASGDEAGADARLDAAAELAPGDARAVALRAARALGRGDPKSPALRLTEAQGRPLARALAAALALRGEGTAEDAPNATLLAARTALERGDVATAAPLLADLAVPELESAALWLAASLAAAREDARPRALPWLKRLAKAGDDDARRVLTARALEVGDAAALEEAATQPGPLGAAERVVVAALANSPLAPDSPQVDAAAGAPGMAPLVAATTASLTGGDAAQVRARTARAVGTPESRAALLLGRLLAARAAASEVEPALASPDGGSAPSTRPLALEMAMRERRFDDVSRELEAWGRGRSATDERVAGALAAALVAEQAGDKARALEAFRAARGADPSNEAALRALAGHDGIDVVAEMNALADELGEGPRGAIARIEAIARAEDALPAPTRAELLERAHRAAPAVPLASFLAERIARRSGDPEEVLRWIRERRAATADPVEAALDGVREALLVGDRDPALAFERLQEAHRARPGDVALRGLYERMATEPLEDRASWRQQRAAEATGDARALLFLEAALEHSRAGNEAEALRCAEAAAEGEAPLARVVRERAELAARQVARLAEELLTAAKGTDDTVARREAYERLAVLDASAREDPASALLWHRSILEETPGHAPSLRHVEQHLIGEGRDEELEPIAAGIATMLKGTGAGEATAHAELAARLRLRGAESDWDATRDMVELAAAEAAPPLWALRMLEAHSRARADDDAFLAVTLRLLERLTRPAEAATLLARAGEAAARLGRLDQARSLLERAASEDPGDVMVWGLLADVLQRAGDARGAAEACESLARSSVVREHQLLAWYDAGRIWSDEAQDDERAIVALESAGAIDPAYEDTFDRLSRLYAARKMQPELAALLERRLEAITDPDERLAMQVRRGKVLLEVGDLEGARAAFEAALEQNPDDASALSAYADLCAAQQDWDATEQALVRLARLLPGADEQRGVYARLGELYSKHLLNLARAEVAYKEVLKRAPEDVGATERLVEVYRRQSDPARAIELQQELVAGTKTPEDKRRRVLELATIHEETGHDVRKAEQTLEAARKEMPQDVAVLRALAEFYQRHHQAPAVNILLDRAGADARRGLAAGRFTPALFEMLATVFDLRGRKEAARVVQAVLAALEGRSGPLSGAGERALDPRLDDAIAPDVLSPAMRALLARTGDALDAASPLDLRGQKAVPVAPDSAVARLVNAIAQPVGLGPVQILSVPRLGATCLPGGSSPPTLLVGEALADQPQLAPYLVLRALKLVQVRASALGRTPPGELPVLVSAWLKCFNPTWQPQGVSAAAVNAAGGRIQAALPRQLDPDVGVIALEVAGNLGTQAAMLGPSALAWGSRIALLALGDPTLALDAIAVAAGATGLPGAVPVTSAPRDPKERMTWITRTAEARDLISFGVSDAFSEARGRLGLDR